MICIRAKIKWSWILEVRPLKILFPTTSAVWSLNVKNDFYFFRSTRLLLLDHLKFYPQPTSPAMAWMTTLNLLHFIHTSDELLKPFKPHNVSPKLPQVSLKFYGKTEFIPHPMFDPTLYLVLHTVSFLLGEVWFIFTDGCIDNYSKYQIGGTSLLNHPNASLIRQWFCSMSILVTSRK